MARFFRVLFLATAFPGSVKVTSARGTELLGRARGIIAPLKVGTVLIIPPRPFVKEVLEDPHIRKMVEKEFQDAFSRTFSSTAATGKV